MHVHSVQPGMHTTGVVVKWSMQRKRYELKQNDLPVLALSACLQAQLQLAVIVLAVHNVTARGAIPSYKYLFFFVVVWL